MSFSTIENHFYDQKELCTKLILSAVKSLEELKLDGTEEEDWGEEISQDFPSLGGTVFPKLVKLDVNHRLHPDVAITRFGQAVTTSSPNLKYLSTMCDNMVQILRVEF